MPVSEPDINHALEIGVKVQMATVQALAALQQQSPAARRQSALSWIAEAEKQITAMKLALERGVA